MTSKIPLKESKGIISQLFNVYLKNIEIDGIKRWNLESFSNDVPAIMVKQLSGETKSKVYMGGAYEATTQFMVVYRCTAEDTKAIMDGTTPLFRLSATFDEETKEGMPNIAIEGIVPLEIAMIATPEKNDIENKVADFMATFIFKYKGGIK